MIINTENNHLTYWYDDDRTKIWRTDDFDTTSMSVGGCIRKPMSLKAELIRTARSLIRDYPDLTLFMSGGLDSEMALRSFLSAGIVPKLVTIRFPDDKNMHDIGPTMQMLDNMGLKYSIIDIDPHEFVMSGEAFEVAERYQVYTMYQQLLMKIAFDYSAPMITFDEVELGKLQYTNWTTGKTLNKWSFSKREDQDAAWLRFNAMTGIPALSSFYTYSPESMLAFLQLPTVDALVNDRIPHKLSWTSSKMEIYSHLGYDFRKRQKWHGVENYMQLWYYVEDKLNSRSSLQFHPRIYKVPVDILRQNLINGVETICQIA